jgi:hypothetical protein
MTPVEDVILDELGRLTASGFPVAGFFLAVTPTTPSRRSGGLDREESRVSQTKQGQVTEAQTTDSSWKSLYIMGGAAALISVLLVLLDIFVSILLPGGEVEPGARSALDWFALFQEDAYYGFRDLGVLNVLNVVLGIPLFLALYAAHRRVNRAYAALAVVLFLFGGAIYVSNNAVFPCSSLAKSTRRLQPMFRDPH